MEELVALLSKQKPVERGPKKQPSMARSRAILLRRRSGDALLCKMNPTDNASQPQFCGSLALQALGEPMLPNSRPFARVSVGVANPKVPLVASYCPGCGLLIAASLRPDLLSFFEEKHVCPESSAFHNDGPRDGHRII